MNKTEKDYSNWGWSRKDIVALQKIDNQKQLNKTVYGKNSRWK